MFLFLKNKLDAWRHRYALLASWQRSARLYPWRLPPARPSLHDVHHYQSVLQRTPHVRNVLVLGITPELRMLAHGFAESVTVADFTPGMFTATEAMVPRPVRHAENQKMIDWLLLPAVLTPHLYDVAFGDLVVRQIRPGDLRKFFRSVRDVLRPNGVMIMRTDVRDSERSADEGARLIAEFMDAVFFRNDPSAPFVHAFRIFNAATNPEKKQIMPHIVSRFFEEAIQNATDHTTRFRLRILRDQCLPTPPWTNLTRKELEECVGEFFEIRQTLFSRDYPDAEHFPLYVLAAK